ncbi:MAG: 50S ribosomal protein L19 [Planctomycetes bacterium]|nr:50S ribosomal protein L19 [Planctomycetota bacterium]
MVYDFENRIERPQWPDFKSGDAIAVSYRIEEGGKVRTQVFRGTCISRRGGGMSESFTVRKVVQGFGVERSFPVNSPNIAEIKLERRGRVKRAKLFYLRDRVGRSTRIAELHRVGEKGVSSEAQSDQGDLVQNQDAPGEDVVVSAEVQE